MNTKKDVKESYRLILFDEYNNEITYETNPDSLTSHLIWKDENKRRNQLKKQNAIITQSYGEKVTVFQHMLKRAAKELNPEQLRLFLLLLSICDFENWIEVTQSDMAKELETQISHISRAMRGLKEKQFVQVIKKGKSNYYRINPLVAWKGSFESHKKIIDIEQKR